MSGPQQHQISASYSQTSLPGGRFVQQSHSAAANATDVAASTTTAISVPGGSGTRSSVAAASGGKVAAIQTTTTEQATGYDTSVEKDPRSQLMFYLSCIGGVFDGFYDVCREIIQDLSFEEFGLLKDHNNFRRLTTEQCDTVLLLADALPPKLFINKCFFQNTEKCGNSSNQFYKIEEVEKSLAIQNDLQVRGERRHISEIMYYTPDYLEDRYFKPMRHLEHRLRAIKKGQHMETFSENYKVHLFLSLLFPFWVIVWTAMYMFAVGKLFQCVYESNPDNASPEETTS